MKIEQFVVLIAQLTKGLQGRVLNNDLQTWLNQEYGPDSDTYLHIKSACQAGIAKGWMCQHEHGGIQFGRVIKPTASSSQFSVDVVLMDSVVGPHHNHPNGEIDLIIPLDESALFDGNPAGWVVYEAGSAHYPTVTQGKAIVLYLLPDGAIEFTR